MAKFIARDLFYDLSKLTNNQFIISTHSSVFINEKSFKHLIRLYKEDKTSKAVLFNDNYPHKIKDLLHILNSTNNEKIFFADVVILVEGVTDRIVFQKIISSIIDAKKLLLVVEIIDIGGKHNKTKFSTFLDSLKIPHSFIADLDYVNEIGTPEIKSLFKVDKAKVDKFAIKNPSSKDAKTLIEKLDEAILTGSTDDLKAFTDYIKSFRRKLKEELTLEQETLLSGFITEQKNKQIFLLTRGEIENYFPEPFKRKDLENVINLLNEENYKEWMQTNEFNELQTIAENILKEFP